MDATEQARPVRATLRDRASLLDGVALAAPPAVAVAVYALPAETRRGLAFAYREPTPLTAYTAHVVHFEAAHLVANLLGYALLVGAGYALALLAGRRRLFRATAATYALAFPPVLSALNLAVPRNAIGYGLSGLNMAFAGAVGVFLVAHARRRIDRRVRVRHAPGAFFAAATVVSLIALPVGPVTAGVAAASATLAAVYAVAAWRDRSPRPAGGPASAGDVDVCLLAAVTFVGYPVVGFPAPAAEGAVINRYVHLLGFCLGFIVPYVAAEAGLFAARDDRG